MTAYCTLIRTGYLPDGILPGSDSTGEPPVVTSSPRCLLPSEVFGDPVEQELLGHAWELAELEPRGPVTEDDGFLECPDGWAITSRTTDLSAMLGPQAARILAAIAEAEKTLISGDPGDVTGVAEAYHAATEADYPAIDAAADAAVAALDAYGADGDWWAEIGACQYGRGEILALAARDLTGTTPEWSQEAYITLTRPWLTAFRRPVHPDDSNTAATT